jgi:hypothetical protein
MTDRPRPLVALLHRLAVGAALLAARRPVAART